MKKPVVNENELTSEENLTNLDVAHSCISRAIDQLTSDYSNTYQSVAIRNLLKDAIHNLNDAIRIVSKVSRIRNMAKENCYVLVDGKLRKMKVEEIIKIVDNDSISQL